MTEKPKKPRILCEECGTTFNTVSEMQNHEERCGWYQIGKREGAKATLEKIERMIQGTSTINALEGGVVALECYYINADAFNRLKAELEGR